MKSSCICNFCNRISRQLKIYEKFKIKSSLDHCILLDITYPLLFPHQKHQSERNLWTIKKLRNRLRNDYAFTVLHVSEVKKDVLNARIGLKVA